MRRPVHVLVAALASLGLLTGCGTTLGDLPLPGSGVSGDTVRLEVDFEEALNLAQGATVKVNGVDSGKVQGVTVEDFEAQAEMLVRTDAKVREGATARLRYNTPLGELFVDITNPAEGPLLEDGARLTTESTSTAPTVEDALAQASLLINGGGLAGLQTVTEELNAALGGREDTVKRLLDQSATFLTEANASTRDIDRALRALADASRELDRREDTINAALRDIRPAAKVLRENTDELTLLLAEVEKFAGTANTTVRRTREQILQFIRQAGPVLAELAGNRDRLGVSLESLVAAGKAVDEVVAGDYANIRLDLNLDQLTLPDLPGLPGLPVATGPAGPGGTQQPRPDRPGPLLPLPLGGDDGSDPLGLGGLLGGLL